MRAGVLVANYMNAVLLFIYLLQRVLRRILLELQCVRPFTQRDIAVTPTLALFAVTHMQWTKHVHINNLQFCRVPRLLYHYGRFILKNY